MSTIPTLYRYMGSHILDTLRDQRLKAASVSEFNDLFECLPTYDGVPNDEYVDYLLRKNLESVYNLLKNKNLTKDELYFKLKSDPEYAALLRSQRTVWEDPLKDTMHKYYRDSIRMISFADNESPTPQKEESKRNFPTKDEREILLWGHYSKLSVGARIGFDFDLGLFPQHKGFALNKLNKVDYVDMRPLIDISTYTPDVEGLPDDDFKLKLAHVMREKFECWQYENEYRLILYIKDKSIPHGDRIIHEWVEDNGIIKRNTFFTFEKSWVTRVDFGCNMDPESKKNLREFLKAEYPDVECYQAQLDKSKYKLIYNELK